MAQRNGLGTMLCVRNWAAEASEAEEQCLVVTRPGAEHWKLHTLLLGPHSYSEATPDWGTVTAVATREHRQKEIGFVISLHKTQISKASLRRPCKYFLVVYFFSLNTI